MAVTPMFIVEVTAVFFYSTNDDISDLMAMSNIVLQAMFLAFGICLQVNKNVDSPYQILQAVPRNLY